MYYDPWGRGLITRETALAMKDEHRAAPPGQVFGYEHESQDGDDYQRDGSPMEHDA